MPFTPAAANFPAAASIAHGLVVIVWMQRRLRSGSGDEAFMDWPQKAQKAQNQEQDFVPSVPLVAISPGFIDSGSAPPQELAAMTKRIPAGYIGTVDDTVAAVRYLLSEEARYVNGANIQISGADRKSVV